MLFSQAISQYLQYLVVSEKSPNTQRSYRTELNRLLDYLDSVYNCPTYLNDLSEQDLENYFYYLKTNEIAPSSRNRSLYIIRAFYNYCCRKRLCFQNLAANLEPVRVPKKVRTYLTEEEFKQLIEIIAHPVVKIVLQTLFYSGLRISECVNLKHRHIDLAQRVIHVVEGKGKKDRDVPINSKLYYLLKNYSCRDRPKVNSPYFFATVKSGRISPFYVNKVLAAAVQSLNWKKKITAHTLRHSFASNLIRQNVNPVLVQKLLGHSSLTTTTIYCHSSLQELQKAVECL